MDELERIQLSFGVKMVFQGLVDLCRLSWYFVFCRDLVTFIVLGLFGS